MLSIFLDHGQKIYLTTKLSLFRLSSDIEKIKFGRDHLIWSFFTFVAGIGVTLTLDLMSKLNTLDKLVEPKNISGLISIVSSSSNYVISFVDVVLSVGAISVGLWLLWQGAWRLKQVGKD